MWHVSESRSVVSNSLQPHGLYSPWNFPGQNTGVNSLSLLQGIFPNQGSNPGLLHCRWILYQLSHVNYTSKQNLNQQLNLSLATELAAAVGSALIPDHSYRCRRSYRAALAEPSLRPQSQELDSVTLRKAKSGRLDSTYSQASTSYFQEWQQFSAAGDGQPQGANPGNSLLCNIFPWQKEAVMWLE